MRIFIVQLHPVLSNSRIAAHKDYWGSRHFTLGPWYRRHVGIGMTGEDAADGYQPKRMTGNRGDPSIHYPNA